MLRRLPARELYILEVLLRSPLENETTLHVMDLFAVMDLGDLPDPMKWAIALWLFAFGACVGSFLNVVIWRLPLGRSVVYPGSRCPACGHAVRSYDNIPILNWLVLRGRCRDCGAGISWRYPAVETLVALLFVGLALVEPLTLGQNLPQPPATASPNLESLVIHWSIYAEQMLLVCTLLCAALMWFDGHAPPERLFVPVILVGSLAPLGWPALRLELFAPLVAAGREVHEIVGLESIAALALGAWTSAASSRWAHPRSLAGYFCWGAMWEVAAIGLVLGPLAAVRVVALASGLFLVTAVAARLLRRGTGLSWTACLLCATMIQLSFWKALANSTAGLDTQDAWPWLAVWGSSLLVLGIAAWVRSGRAEPEPGWNRDWPVRSPTATDHDDHSESVPISGE